MPNGNLHVRYLMKWVLLLLGLTVTACESAQQDSGAYTEMVLKGDAIAKQIQTTLQGSKGELHSDRVDEDGTRHPACFIQLGPALKDRRFEFSLPDRVVDLGIAGKVVYKVNDVRLGTIDVETSNSEFVFRAGFTSNGVALKDYHSSLGDAAVPDIKLENILLTIHIKPTVTQDGGISYDQPKVDFTADVDNTFIPRFSLFGKTIDVVDTLTNYRHDLCTAVQKQIQTALDDPVRKAALGKKIQEGIAGRLAGPGSALLGLRFQGADLVVRFRR